MPPVTEQRRIVDILEDHLSRLDSALQYLPTGKRTDALVASTASKALRGVGGAPETIGSIAQEVKNGIFVARASSKPDGVPILRIGAVRSLSLDLKAVGFSRRSSADIRASGTEVVAGDLLFTRYNGNPAYVASCAVVPAGAGLLTYPDKLIRVRMDDTRTLPAFVAIAATFGRTRADLQAHVKTTSGQAGISGRDLKAAEVDVPSLEDQASVVQVVEHALVSARRLASEAERIRVRTKALRSALLAAAFSGRLTGRATDLDRAEEMAT